MLSYFGVRWDAPAFDEATQVPTPTGEPCSLCGEPIEPGESGTFMLHIDADGTATLRPQHIECHLRSILGSVDHLKGTCTCGDGTGEEHDRPYRQQARELMEHLIGLRAEISRAQEDY